MVKSATSADSTADLHRIAYGTPICGYPTRGTPHYLISPITHAYIEGVHVWN